MSYGAEDAIFSVLEELGLEPVVLPDGEVDWAATAELISENLKD